MGSGKVTGPDTLLVDLSSKGGPAALAGEWSGTGIVWTMEGDHAIEGDGADNWPKVAGAF